MSLADRRDAMLVAMSRQIVDGDVVGVGLGTPMAVLAGLLARSTHAPGAHLLVGGAVNPDADLETCLAGPEALVGRTTGFVPHLDTMGQAERQAMTLQFLRPAQTDGAGAMNVSAVHRDGRPAVRLPGGLAVADVPALLPRLVVHLPTHRARNLPPRVDVATGSGHHAGPTHRTRGVVAIITELCVIATGAGGARLVSHHPGVAVEQVVTETGFALELEGSVCSPGPSDAERHALAALDPTELRYQLR